MNLTIVYEDEEILVVNKPVGVVVNRANSIKVETIQDWVESRKEFVDLRSSIVDETFLQRSGICHRLDKETSGCLLIAKNPKSLHYYLGLFKNRLIVKVYKTLVHGRVEPKTGEVVLPLKRSIFDREKWKVRFDGKRAVTMWKVVDYFQYETENEHWKNNLSLLEVGLKTGRTHQIRVHMSFLGWPIFADEKYLNFRQSRSDRDYLWHHFLHAYFLSFKKENGDVLEVTSPLPEECEYFLKNLEVVS